MAFRSISRSVAKRFRTTLSFLLLACWQLPARADEPVRLPLPDGLVLKAPTIPKSVVGTVRTINEALSKNVAPQENAAVWLVQVFGDEMFEPELHDASLDMLGIASLAKDGPRFLFLEAYVESLGTVPEMVRREAILIQDSIIQAGSRVWKADELPRAAAYIDANRAALDALVAAADLPELYIPMLCPAETPQLLSASLVVERRVPFIARTLTARALLRAANRNFAAASADLLACHKLAVRLARGCPFDVTCGKATAADAFASQGEFALLASGTLTAMQANAHRQALERIPRLACAADAADRGERAILHREIELLQHDKNSVRDFYDLPQSDDKTDKAPRLPAVPWELAYQRADEIQDRIVRALATRSHQEQNALFRQLDRDYEEYEKTADDRTKEIAATIDKNPDAASRWMGETMAMSLRPIYRQRRVTDDRMAVNRDLVVLGLALVAYQREHGEFPTEVSDLAPRYLPAVPLDAYSDAPFAYRRTAKDQARLISWGANAQDDALKTYNDDLLIDVR